MDPIAILKALVSAGALVGAAWWLVQRYIGRRDAKHDARRGELRAKIDDATRLSRLIEHDAHEYFVLDATDPRALALERTIHRGFTTLSTVQYDIDSSLPGAYAGTCYRRYKKTVTIGDFQSERRLARSHADSLLDDISAAARLFEQNLERAFRTEFDDRVRGR